MGAPGVVRPLANYRGWRKQGGNVKRSIEEKREAVIRGIDRWLKREKGAPALEYFDPEQRTPVIRVLYAAKPLPIFEGEPFAVIDPECDRKTLWAGISDEIRRGAHDGAIEEVARGFALALERNRLKVL